MAFRRSSVRTKYVAPLTVLLAISAGVAVVIGQRTVPFSNGIPVAPTGLANKPLGAGPFVYDTGEGQKIRVVVTKGLVEGDEIALQDPTAEGERSES